MPRTIQVLMLTYVIRCISHWSWHGCVVGILRLRESVSVKEDDILAGYCYQTSIICNSLVIYENFQGDNFSFECYANVLELLCRYLCNTKGILFNIDLDFFLCPNSPLNGVNVPMVPLPTSSICR